MEAARDAQVGILFVHGIGQQTPGDTLIAFGEPLMRWVRRWIERRHDVSKDPRGELQILRSALSEPVLQAGEPAHLLFEGRRTDRDPPLASRWLLAESCWATEFRQPPFGRLAAWMVGVGAWMILSHFGKLLRLRLAGWKRWALGLPVLLLAVVLALLTQLLVAVLGLVALLPIPRLRRALSGLLLTLTGTLGDSYVLISSPVQEAAAVSRLRRDLGWLADRVESVVVVAHSQGAAIARRTLQGPRPTNLSRLVTFGSGIGKLDELRLLAHPSNRTFYLAVQFGLPLATLSILLLPRAISTLQGSYLFFGLNLYFFLFVCAPVVLLAWILAMALSGRPYTRDLGRPEPPLDGLQWRDFYATADPVPNGPPSEGAAGGDELRWSEVVNLRSAVADHSAYWANQDEFVSALVAEIDSAAGVAGAGAGLVTPSEIENALPAGAAERRKRVRVLLAMRAAAAAGAFLALVGLRDQLRGLAETFVWRPLARWSATGLLGSVVETVASGVGAAARLLTGASAETLGSWGLLALGALLLWAAVAVWYLIATRVWSWWDRFAIDDFLAQEKLVLSTRGVAAVAILLGATPLVFGVAALATRDLRTSLGFVATAFQLYFKLLAVGVLFGIGGIAGWVFLMSYNTLASRWKKIAAGTAAVLVGVSLLTLAVAAVLTRDLRRSLDIVVATNLRLAAVALLPAGMVVGVVALFFLWKLWDESR